MPKASFLVFEALVVGLTALCLWHAARQDRRRVVEFVASMAFGVMLEVLTIRQLQAYHYGRFLLMVGEVPLAVGMGWAVIIYSVMETARAWQVPTAAVPFFCALLAWNIDLSMDAIAIRMGMWTWSYYGEWFGVPLGNFFAWYIVVAAFSATTVELRSHLRPVPAALASIAVSLAALMSLDLLYVYYAAPSRQVPVLAALLVAALMALGAGRQAMRAPAHVDLVGSAVPFVFHAFFTAMLFINGYYRAIPALMAVCIGMFAIGAAVHLAPLYARRPSARGT